MFGSFDQKTTLYVSVATGSLFVVAAAWHYREYLPKVKITWGKDTCNNKSNN